MFAEHRHSINRETSQQHLHPPPNMRPRMLRMVLLDAVGFALEDFTALRLVYRMAEALEVGRELMLIPALENPKNLFALIASPNNANNKSTMSCSV